MKKTDIKLVLLDAATLGNDVDISCFEEFGSFISYETTDENEKYERAKDADIVITNKVIFDREFLRQLPHLKLIALTATGMNNVDLEAASELKIEVKNVAGYSTKSVAQHTFALALHTIGNLAFYEKYVKEGKWCKSNIFTNLDMPFFEISGKKWGIIGMGSIGREVAKIAQSFGAKVSYFSTSGVKRREKYPNYPLKTLLASSDIVSIHAPLNKKTEKLLGKSEFSQMKQNAVLINVARGGIIDEYALKNAIKNEKIYAAIDVLEYEPMKKNSPLFSIRKHPRILITPHVAWGSVEARTQLLKLVCKHIKTFIKERWGGK